MNWEKVKLEDICQITGGTTPKTNRPEFWDGTIVWLSPVDLPEVGSITDVYSSQRMITREGLASCSLRVLPVGSLVFSTRASIGKIGIVKTLLTTNQGFTNFIPGERVNVRYLAYVLKKSIPAIEKLGNSTTFNEVSRTAIKHFEIPLPPLPVQQQIADALDKADALRRKDQELLDKYDELAQAVFYDMFGDPVRNEKGWEGQKLKDICTQITDGTHFSPPSVPVGVPYITAKHLKKYGLDFFANPTYIDENKHKEIYKRCRPEKGDVLYIKDGATTGLAAINEYDFEFSMLSSLALIKPNQSVLTSVFLKYWLNNNRVKGKLINEFMAGAAIQRFTLSKINQFQVYLPPLKLQISFGEKIIKLEKLKLLHSKTCNSSKSLFDALISKSFNN